MTAFCSHTVPQMFGSIDLFINHGQGNFSRCLQWVEILVPPGTGTFLRHCTQFMVPWIEVSTRGGPVIHIDEIWDMHLQPFLHFLTLWAGAGSCWSTIHHCLWIQFPPEVVRHRITWLGRPHHSSLHRHCKNESGLHQSTKLSTKPLPTRGDDLPELLGVCLWCHNNFWHIRSHFGDWISLWYWKSFHFGGCGFLEAF